VVSPGDELLRVSLGFAVATVVSFVGLAAVLLRRAR
jgi:hypothetical protein